MTSSVRALGINKNCEEGDSEPAITPLEYPAKNVCYRRAHFLLGHRGRCGDFLEQPPPICFHTPVEFSLACSPPSHPRVLSSEVFLWNV